MKKKTSILRGIRKSIGILVATPIGLALGCIVAALALAFSIITNDSSIFDLKNFIYSAYGFGIGSLIGIGSRHIFYTDYKKDFDLPGEASQITLDNMQEARLNEYLIDVRENSTIQVDLIANPVGHIHKSLEGMAGNHGAINIKVDDKLLMPLEILGNGKYYKFPSQKQEIEIKDKEELEKLYIAYIYVKDKHYANLFNPGLGIYSPGKKDCITFVNDVIKTFNVLSGKKIVCQIGRFGQNEHPFSQLAKFALNIFRGFKTNPDTLGADQSMLEQKKLSSRIQPETQNEISKIVKKDLKKRKRKTIFRIFLYTLLALAAFSIRFMPIPHQINKLNKIDPTILLIVGSASIYYIFFNITKYYFASKSVKTKPEESVDSSFLSKKAKIAIGRKVLESEDHSQSSKPASGKT